MMGNNQSQKPTINMQRVGELLPSITRRTITGARFRFNLSPQEALDILTTAYCYEVKSRHVEPKIDERTAENLISLAEFITSDVPKFGLMFCGTVGNGKTTLMKALQRSINYLNDQRHFSFMDDERYGYRYEPGLRIVDVREILRAAKEDSKAYDALKTKNVLGIDDLGKEPAEIMDYGNILSPVIDLIEHRYDKQLFTVITTNLVGKEIRAKYGDRIADRFNEMLHVIVFRNSTYR